MRNLKKLLALVLAMVMAFSLMLSASAAAANGKDDFADSEEVTPEFVEAVSVLTGLKVIQGDSKASEDSKATFRPQDPITRAEAAALVYRIATGDIEGTQVKLYSDYGKFDDVKKDDWFAGYVGYCQNAGIIKGKTPTLFRPYDNVTGYEVLAMILRAVGYGKNGEFTGTGWQVNVASLGKTKHITDSVTSAAYNYTLNMNARREIVAELLFRGSLIPTVTWSSALGYNEFQSVISVDGNRSYNRNLAWNVFRLYRYGWRYGDDFGRPELVWKASLNPTSTTPREVAVLAADYTEAFHETKRECDVAELMNFGTAEYKDYVLFVNNDERVTDKYHVVATDTVTKVGGMGRQVEIYTEKKMNEQYPFHDWYSYWSTTDGKDVGLTAPKDTIVMVDTIVAKVLNKTDAVLDGKDHIIVPAKLTVDLYDGDVNEPTRRTISKPTTSKDNWEFAIGDVLSLNGISDTEGTANATTGVVSGDESHAFRTDLLTKWNSTSNKEKSALVEDTDVFEITKLTGTSGKQTVVYKNADKHQVDGKDIDDDLTLKLDKAGDNVNTTFIWYYDQYGFVQAIEEGSANFGVITAVYAAFGTGDANTSTTGTAKAIATVKFSDGTDGTVEIDRFLMRDDGSDISAKPAKDSADAKMEDRLAETDKASDNAIELWPVYDTGTNEPMSVVEKPANLNLPLTNVSATDTGSNETVGMLNLAPAAISNANSHIAGNDKHGVLFDHLFKFVKTANDQMVAVEVAGNDNSGIFSNNYSQYTDHAGDNGRLIKSLSMVSGKDNSTEPLVWIDNNTQILVRTHDAAKNINTIAFYNGVSALPGDVKIDKSAAEDESNDFFTNEIDWADTDNDGRAEVLYITGKIDGQVTYGLFYYNDGTAQWNGTNGTLEGFLNGEQKTLTFTDYAQYNDILTSTATYKGHLFAVEQTMGVVTDVMQKNYAYNTTTTNFADGTNWNTKILAASTNYATGVWSYGWSGYVTGDYEDSFGGGSNKQLTNIFKSGNDATTPANHNNNPFKLGTGTGGDPKWGNPYSTATRAAYYEDTIAGVVNAYQLKWVPSVVDNTGTIEVRNSDTNADNKIDDLDNVTATYYVNPGTKVWGMGSGVVYGESALEYLNKAVVNDVTIVFNTTSGSDRAALEVYVATDPDITDTPDAPAVVPSSDVVVSKETTFATFETSIKAIGTGVYYNKSLTDLGWAQTKPEQALFFAYTDKAGSTTVTLQIFDADGNLRYVETNGATGAGGHYFGINFTKDVTGDDGTWYNGSAGLSAGTYTYRVVIDGAVSTGNQGSFTLK